MINFLAEIASRFERMVLPTPSAEQASLVMGIIYEIDIREHPAESYWLDWGGYFNNLFANRIMLYYREYLSPVSNMDTLRNTLNSIFIQDRMAFIHLPKHPWLFSDYATSFESVIPFLSNALDPDNPSNNIIGGANAQTRLEIPSFTVKLSDSIAGVTLNQGFSITFHNDDGYFDDENSMNIFNTPLYLKKTSGENPQYEDFKLIRNGYVENKNTTFDKTHITVADKFRALERPVCNIFKQENFDFTLNGNILNKQIPLVYGRNKVSLIKLSDTKYLAAENAVLVVGVFNRNGEPITDYSFDGDTGILTIEKGEASEAIVWGTGHRIGEIINDILVNRANITRTDTNFDMHEFMRYFQLSPRINITITGGTIRNAVESLLKNDMAFFIQQTDGRFTIRTYADKERYPLHVIPAWAITRKPEKDYSKAQDNYFSSCIITFFDSDPESISYIPETISFLHDFGEADAEKLYRRRVRRTFHTYLTHINDVQALAMVLSDRYTNMKQTIKLAVGVNTADFELLDRVQVDLNINGRKFSNSDYFIITEINHSQDILTLEEI